MSYLVENSCILDWMKLIKSPLDSKQVYCHRSHDPFHSYIYYTFSSAIVSKTMAWFSVLTPLGPKNLATRLLIYITYIKLSTIQHGLRGAQVKEEGLLDKQKHYKKHVRLGH